MKRSQKPASDILLKRRDQFIADRINDTLGPGETGILFLGMLHSLGHLLDEQIKVVYPISGPVEQVRPNGMKENDIKVDGR